MLDQFLACQLSLDLATVPYIKYICISERSKGKPLNIDLTDVRASCKLLDLFFLARLSPEAAGARQCSRQTEHISVLEVLPALKLRHMAGLHPAILGDRRAPSESPNNRSISNSLQRR